MTVNPGLNALLDQTLTVYRPTETVVRGYTSISLSSTAVGSVSSHVQPLTPLEVQQEWGMEVQGDYQGFFNSTVDVRVGDYLKQTKGPSPTGEKRWWVRGLLPSDTRWAQHTCALLERTSEFSTL